MANNEQIVRCLELVSRVCRNMNANEPNRAHNYLDQLDAAIAELKANSEQEQPAKSVSFEQNANDMAECFDRGIARGRELEHEELRGKSEELIETCQKFWCGIESHFARAMFRDAFARLLGDSDAK